MKTYIVLKSKTRRNEPKLVLNALLGNGKCVEKCVEKCVDTCVEKRVEQMLKIVSRIVLKMR